MTDTPKIVPIEHKDAALPVEPKIDVVGPAVVAPAAAPDVVKK